MSHTRRGLPARFPKIRESRIVRLAINSLSLDPDRYGSRIVTWRISEHRLFVFGFVCLEPITVLSILVIVGIEYRALNRIVIKLPQSFREWMCFTREVRKTLDCIFEFRQWQDFCVDQVRKDLRSATFCPIPFELLENFHFRVRSKLPLKLTGLSNANYTACFDRLLCDC